MQKRGVAAREQLGRLLERVIARSHLEKESCMKEAIPPCATNSVSSCFDEVQNVPGWERFVRRLLDTELVRVIVKGSYSAVLGREIATNLRGRSHRASAVHLSRVPGPRGNPTTGPAILNPHSKCRAGRLRVLRRTGRSPSVRPEPPPREPPSGHQAFAVRRRTLAEPPSLPASPPLRARGRE